MVQWLYHCHLINFLKVLSIHQPLIPFPLLKSHTMQKRHWYIKKNLLWGCFFSIRKCWLCVILLCGIINYIVFLNFLARFFSARNMKCSKIYLPEFLQRMSWGAILSCKVTMNLMHWDFEGEIFQGTQGRESTRVLWCKGVGGLQELPQVPHGQGNSSSSTWEARGCW